MLLATVLYDVYNLVYDQFSLIYYILSLNVCV